MPADELRSHRESIGRWTRERDGLLEKLLGPDCAAAGGSDPWSVLDNPPPADPWSVLDNPQALPDSAPPAAPAVVQGKSGRRVDVPAAQPADAADATAAIPPPAEISPPPPAAADSTLLSCAPIPPAEKENGKIDTYENFGVMEL